MRLSDKGGGCGLVLLILLLIQTSNSKEQDEQCSYEATTDTLKCNVSALTASSNKSTSNGGRFAALASTSSGRVKNLEVSCSDEAVAESSLRTNYFGFLPNLRKLSVDGCKVRKIPSLAFSGLSGLTSLKLETRNAEWSSMTMELDKDSLTGLNSLRDLDLTSDSLWSLPNAVFCSLGSLTNLNLSTNYLQDIQELGFGSDDINSCKLPLRSLDLSGNSYSQVPAGSFGQLRKLEHLDVSSNNLNVVDDKALSGLTSLTTLNLANNQLVALPPLLFSALNEVDNQEEKEEASCCQFLQELHLQNNSLSGLAPGLFTGLEHLLVLNLSRNDVSNDWLNPETFNSLRRLVALDLSHNRLTRLDQSLLSPLTSLQLLDLSHNQIHTLTGNTFLSQYNLHILRLSFNHLNKLHSQSLSGLSVLSTLSLHHNRIKNLHPQLMANCSGLVDLELHANLFSKVPNRALAKLPRLKTLDLGENAISNLSIASLRGLKNIYALRLAKNGIRQINGTVFEAAPNIKVLNLANNEITEFHQNMFNHLKKLRMLRLDSNKLKDINGLLAGLIELKWLNISANQLQWFDYAFIPKNLEWLNLKGNEIEDLGNYYKLDGDFALKTLDASSNKIKKLDSLSFTSGVQVVNVSENKIKSVAAGTFSAKSSLRKVDLTSNLIEQLQLPALAIKMASNQDPLPEFKLGDNNFLCDCEMEWLQKINKMVAHRQYPKIIDMEDIKCRLNNHHPNQTAMTLHSVMDVRPDQFVCQYRAHCFALCMCCDFFACDCRMQCPEGCSCFHDSTWSANIIQCSMREHLDIPPLIPMDATSIFLDGNNFTGTLESQAFIGRKRVQSLYLNHSLIEAISNQTFNGLTELEVLHLENNRIHRLEGYEFSNLSSLLTLHLEDNLLTFIHEKTFKALGSLTSLHLQRNRLQSYQVWSLQVNLNLVHLTLGQNPWSCDCDFVQKFQDFALAGPLVSDLSEVQCHSGDDRINLSENVTCSDAMAVILHRDYHNVLTMIPLLALIVAVCVVISCTGIILFVFRTPLRVWLHSKYGIRVLDPCGKLAQDKLYDAFVSYSLKDEDFVQQIIVPQLEHEEPGYKLCLQHRDLPNTSSIADTFPGVSQLCAKHVLIVSRTYLETEWSQIKYALQQQEHLAKKLKPVIILLDQLSSLDLAAAPEFNLLLSAGPSVRWNEAGFWNKLRFYLPDSSRLRATFKRNLGSKGQDGNGNGTSIALHTSSPKPAMAMHTNGNKYNAGWQYDGLLHSNNSSSTSTRSTGSPHTLGSGGSDSSRGSQPTGNVLSNPLSDHFDQHTYQTIGDVFQHKEHLSKQQQQQQQTQQPQHFNLSERQQQHIYHTLDPDVVMSNGGQPLYDTLGKLDVMLPNGQFVPATLVRSNVNGRVVPLVEMNSQTLPPNNGPSSPMRGPPGGKGPLEAMDDVIEVSLPKSSARGSKREAKNRRFV